MSTRRRAVDEAAGSEASASSLAWEPASRSAVAPSDPVALSIAELLGTGGATSDGRGSAARSGGSGRRHFDPVAADGAADDDGGGGGGSIDEDEEEEEEELDSEEDEELERVLKKAKKAKGAPPRFDFEKKETLRPLVKSQGKTEISDEHKIVLAKLVLLLDRCAGRVERATATAPRRA